MGQWFGIKKMYYICIHLHISEVKGDTVCRSCLTLVSCSWICMLRKSWLLGTTKRSEASSLSAVWLACPFGAASLASPELAAACGLNTSSTIGLQEFYLQEQDFPLWAVFTKHSLHSQNKFIWPQEVQPDFSSSVLYSESRMVICTSLPPSPTTV